MNIGLYQEPTNPSLPYYKGLYRQNGIIDLYESDNLCLIKKIDWYFCNSREGNYLKYTEDNKRQLFSLYKMLKTEKWNGEIILFTDNVETEIPTNCELLGYDICAGSKYYSPLGDGILQMYNMNKAFFAEISTVEFKKYKDNINGNGLFSTYSVAFEFSKYCNIINERYEHAVESEKNWRPFAVYTFVRQGTVLCLDS